MRSGLVQGAFALYVVLILLMTPISRALWEHVSLLHKVQFPWRLLSLIAILQVLCAASVARLARPGPTRDGVRRRPKAAVLACLAILAYHSGPPVRRVNGAMSKETVAMRLAETRENRLKQVQRCDGLAEWLPRTVKRVPQAGRDEVLVSAADPDTRLRALPGNTIHHLQYTVEAPSTGTRVRINQFHARGWRVEVDGSAVGAETLVKTLPPEGTIRVDVPGGTHRLEAWYDGPPGWRLRLLAVALLTVAFAGFLVWERRSSAVRSARDVAAVLTGDVGE